MNRATWRGRRVFLTGHTGFKGSWLALWLADMGAEVHGYALAPPKDGFFCAVGVHSHLASSTLADLRDLPALRHAMSAARPEVVFHLAAQALVRQSYAEPVETFAVNVLGTAHVLEAARAVEGVRAVVCVTTDKVYENREWPWAYRENDPLGGHDPYAASKACAELVTASYRASFLAAAGVQVATVRAGNVIGGGDCSMDRLVPDILRAVDAGETLVIRAPNATRPWQHVLEPLSGYLLLAERLLDGGPVFADAWNFGPADGDARPVQWIVEQLSARLGGAPWRLDAGPRPKEAHALRLDSSRAAALLGWRPAWDLAIALDHTVAWHRAWRAGDDLAALSLAQMRAREAAGAP